MGVGVGLHIISYYTVCLYVSIAAPQRYPPPLPRNPSTPRFIIYRVIAELLTATIKWWRRVVPSSSNMWRTRRIRFSSIQESVEDDGPLNDTSEMSGTESHTHTTRSTLLLLCYTSIHPSNHPFNESWCLPSFRCSLTGWLTGSSFSFCLVHIDSVGSIDLLQRRDKSISQPQNFRYVFCEWLMYFAEESVFNATAEVGGIRCLFLCPAAGAVCWLAGCNEEWTGHEMTTSTTFKSSNWKLLLWKLCDFFFFFLFCCVHIWMLNLVEGFTQLPFIHPSI